VTIQIINSDVLEGLATLADGSVNCCVTSPPYWGLRDYGMDGQIGLEDTPEAFVARLVEVFRDVRRVLADDGTCWVNLGDSYNNFRVGQCGQSLHDHEERSKPVKRRRGSVGLKEKDLVGIPWMFAFAARADGWYLRRDIIWSKPNPMPESVTDRCTSAHEYVFMLTKSARYFYDADAIKEPAAQSSVARWAQNIEGQAVSDRANGGAKTNGPMKAVGGKQRGHKRRHNGFNDRWDGMTKAEQQSLGANKRSVWTVATQPFSEAHFATFPPALIEPMIKAGCPVGGTVLDPFGGAGTTGLVADRLQRNAILIELNPEYAAIADRRINGDRGGLLDVMEAAE
jgi:DNA modification methylase